jgi:hypothetical protein
MGSPLDFFVRCAYLVPTRRIGAFWVKMNNKGNPVTADRSIQERNEPQFGALSFHCPVSTRTVSTGIYTDEHSVARLRTIRLRIRCPHCGEEHAIQVGDTFVSSTIIDHHRPNLSLVSSR